MYVMVWIFGVKGEAAHGSLVLASCYYQTPLCTPKRAGREREEGGQRKDKKKKKGDVGRG